MIKNNIKNPLCLNGHYVNPFTGNQAFSRSGKNQSVEGRIKISEANKHPSDAARKARSETATKMCQTNRGKKRPHSTETRRRISEALKGKPKTEQHKVNLSLSLRQTYPLS